ncbi:MAG: hypothetical protein IPK07_20505 [Deltaproteobacteria bacterium]|nr:hypothetical protein [Deltaproteobacteria bacterium]
MDAFPRTPAEIIIAFGKLGPSVIVTPNPGPGIIGSSANGAIEPSGFTLSTAGEPSGLAMYMPSPQRVAGLVKAIWLVGSPLPTSDSTYPGAVLPPIVHWSGSASAHAEDASAIAVNRDTGPFVKLRMSTSAPPGDRAYGADSAGTSGQRSAP